MSSFFQAQCSSTPAGLRLAGLSHIGGDGGGPPSQSDPCPPHGGLSSSIKKIVSLPPHQAHDPPISQNFWRALRNFPSLLLALFPKNTDFAYILPYSYFYPLLYTFPPLFETPSDFVLNNAPIPP